MNDMHAQSNILKSPSISLLSDRNAIHATIILFLILVQNGTMVYSYSDDRLWRLLIGYPLGGIINALLVCWGVSIWRQAVAMMPSMTRRAFLLYFIWVGILIIRSFDPSFTGMRNLFFNNWGATALLLPLVSFLSINAEFWPNFFQYGKYFLALGILCVGVQVILYTQGRPWVFPLFDRYILAISALYYLTGFLCRLRHIVMGSIGLLIWAAFEFFVSQRENLVLVAWYFMVSLFLAFRSPVLRFKGKIILILIFSLFATICSIGGLNILVSSIETQSLQLRINNFIYGGEALRNTRTGAFDDFMQDMNLTDLIFGRGAVATYHTQYPGLVQDFLDGNQRYIIEIGHLQQTLTGGIILNILFNFIALGAIYQGLKNTHNQFTKVLALIVLGYVLLMFTAAPPIGQPRYFLVLLAIGGCWSTELRSMSTRQFMNLWHRYENKSPNSTRLIILPKRDLKLLNRSEI